MKEVVLITGASGMLAQYLANNLANVYAFRFLTRNPINENEFLWDINNEHIDDKALKGVDHIIHLAGASVAEKRWTTNRKKEILSSRVDSARLILNKLQENQLTIKSFISASAVGYYGTNTSENILTEESPNGNDFLSAVCNQWENAALQFKANNIAERVAIFRIGIILQKNEGALKKMTQPIKYGIGSALGNGKQYVPWIHIEDLSRLLQSAIENQNINDTFNAVAPQHITNKEFTNKIAKHLNKRILLPPIPKFILKLIFGEMAVILIEGSKISPKKILNIGFKFKYDNIDKALKDIL